jgi:hypothetical protein
MKPPKFCKVELDLYIQLKVYLFPMFVKPSAVVSSEWKKSSCKKRLSRRVALKIRLGSICRFQAGCQLHLVIRWVVPHIRHLGDGVSGLLLRNGFRWWWPGAAK